MQEGTFIHDHQNQGIQVANFSLCLSAGSEISHCLILSIVVKYYRLTILSQSWTTIICCVICVIITILII